MMQPMQFGRAGTIRERGASAQPQPIAAQLHLFLHRLPAHLRVMERTRRNLDFALTTARQIHVDGAGTASGGPNGASIPTLLNTPAPAPDAAEAPPADDPPADAAYQAP
jgi:hypothetical protein